MPTIEEIKEILKRVKQKSQLKKPNEISRPSPMPGISPFVIGYPIVKQDYHHESFDTKRKDITDESLMKIRKAGF
jgi:hypothetical protein